jgi:hypothetical protein
MLSSQQYASAGLLGLFKAQTVKSPTMCASSRACLFLLQLGEAVAADQGAQTCSRTHGDQSCACLACAPQAALDACIPLAALFSCIFSSHCYGRALVGAADPLAAPPVCSAAALSAASPAQPWLLHVHTSPLQFPQASHSCRALYSAEEKAKAAKADAKDAAKEGKGAAKDAAKDGKDSVVDAANTAGDKASRALNADLKPEDKLVKARC